MRAWLSAAFALALCAAGLGAAPVRLRILHTNDLHSHVQGVSPESDYTPLEPGDDATLGGWARLAAAISAEREGGGGPVLVLDAGDFMMGTLFHTLAREEAVELGLLAAMGYDAVSLGNHEFDLGPDGLARVLSAASRRGGLPPVLLAGAVFDAVDAKDDALAGAFAAGLVQPYRVVEKGGLRFGLFAILGKDAAEVAPFAAPVAFGDPAETARQMVTLLRDKEKADVVICLSHSGLSGPVAGSEDVLLAREVPGIDVIVSGHSHTRLESPITQGGVVIVQAWENGRQLGVLDLDIEDGNVRLAGWKTVTLDDSIRGDAALQGRIDSFKALIDRQVLADHGLTYGEVIAETTFDLELAEAEAGLGNLVADCIRWGVERAASDPADPATRVTLAVESGGMIRDGILRGSTGRLTAADLFRVLPLGIGPDGAMGYPLLSMYLTAAEIRKALEIVASVHPLKGSDYFLHVSGVRFAYNPRRMLFDRVTRVEVRDQGEGWLPLDTSPRNRTLYRVVANNYNSAFLKLIGGFTFHILDIVPKDRSGAPIADLSSARIDVDPGRPGVQELKEWAAFLECLRRFPDSDGDGVPEIPARYQRPEGRIVKEPSLNPAALLAGGGMVTWAALAALVVAAGLLAGAALLAVRLARRIGRRPR